jgi:acetate kinase
MDKKYLIVNRGSSSEKYAIYTAEKRLAFIHAEKAEEGCDYVSTLFINDNQETGCITKKQFDNSLDYALNLFKEKEIIADKTEIQGIGIRIVAPGKHFQADRVIDEVYEQEIKKVVHDAPLHLLPTYEMIKILKKTFKNIPIVGVSDSDFHDTIPDKAKYYGLPWADTQKYGIQKYGYHGISIEAIINRLKEEGPLPTRLVVCHIGSGVSITAVKDGQSIENSMGLTPLEGVMMATRGGDIDPGVINFLTSKLGFWRRQKIKDYLNKKCGLLGVSGQSSDVRDLIKLEKDGDQLSRLALEMYIYRIQKYLGAYFVALGGLDAIVFTGTVGERSFIIRERVCQALDVLGVKINKEINDQSEGVDVMISTPDSRVKVLVRKTDEMGQIARDTVQVLAGN